MSSPSVPTPVLDERDEAAFLAELAARIPGYVPGWSVARSGPSQALARIFARFMQILVRGINQVPGRQQLAFLDMIGMHLLPAESGQAPVVFSLMDDSPIDPLLAVDSQMAAPAPPPPPSPISGATATAPDAVVFATTQAVTLIRGQLTAHYVLEPGEDSYGDYSARPAEGWSLFGDLDPVEHAVYLGHDSLFALAGEASIILFVTHGGGSTGGDVEELEIDWEYLSADGWLPLEIEEDEDGKSLDKSNGLTQDGELHLQKEACSPDAVKQDVGGKTSYWIRGTLVTSLPPDAMGGAGFAPTLDGIRAQVAFTKEELAPEAAMSETSPVDVTKDFYPFNLSPISFATFYLGSKEVFQRRGAEVEIAVTLSKPGAASDDLALAYEYWNGDSWQPLLEGFDDGTDRLKQSGSITFTCPRTWAESTIAGQSNYWLRIRITAGDYGKPLSVEVVDDAVTVIAATLAPPAVKSVTLAYTYQTDPTDLDYCLTYNDFTFTDESDACRWPRQTFQPFRALAERSPAVYFGFDEPLPIGLVSIYASVGPADPDDAASDEVAFAWEYDGPAGWTEMAVLDETEGFRRSGMIQLIGPSDAVASSGLGGDLYRIRARVKEGGETSELPLAGLWPNAAYMTNRFNVTLEALGDSDGNADQSLYVKSGRVPVLEGEVLEVREWSGYGAGWELLAEAAPPADVRIETDPVSDQVRALWIRWHEQPHLFSSAPDARDYMIERATGRIRFGDGVCGAIPPAGCRVVLSYSTGGGTAGNVAAGAISELRSGVPYLQKATNPVAAEGGAETEAVDAIHQRGPMRMRHRDRAVTALDYEWLARDASAAVARARCLPLTGPEGAVQRGFVTVLVVPHDDAPTPTPTASLRQRVIDYLAARMPASAAGQVRVIGPRYVPVSVVAEVVPRRPSDAAIVEARLLERLSAFLHPLTGGPSGEGWDFGAAVSLSQIARLLEETDGVDCAPRIELRVAGALCGEWVEVGHDQLVAAGVHELKMTLRVTC